MPHGRSSSGTLTNLAKRVLMRTPPSGATSTWVTVSPKVAANVSKSMMPMASSRSGRRNRSIVYASPIELAIGVADANVTTRGWRLRRYSIFMCRSLARFDPGTDMFAMFDGVRRFLYPCASSTLPTAGSCLRASTCGFA